MECNNSVQFQNCISQTPKVSKYIANLVGLIFLKKSGTNLRYTRDPQKLIYIDFQLNHIHTGNADQFRNYISGTIKVSKYIANIIWSMLHLSNRKLLENSQMGCQNENYYNSQYTRFMIRYSQFSNTVLNLMWTPICNEK